MGRLLEIKTEIGALLTSITIANGFTFDFGTVNPIDRGKITAWPAANIVLKSEIPASEIARQQGFDVCQVEIEIFSKMDEVNTNPMQSFDTENDVIIPAIKKKFRANLGKLPITGSGVLRYTGWRRQESTAGDTFSPYRLILTCEILYNSNE